MIYISRFSYYYYSNFAGNILLDTSTTLSLESKPMSEIIGSKECVSLLDMDKTLPKMVLPTVAPTNSVLKLSK